MILGEEDFSSTPIEIVMPPSSLSNEDYEFNILIMADTKYEAEESFVLIIRVDEEYRSALTTTAIAARCMIRDDDGKQSLLKL